MWLIAVIWITIGAGCQSSCPATTPQIVALQLPARPVLPAIKAEEVKCLSDDTNSRVAERNRLQRQYAEEMETIILSTHKPR